MVVHIDKLIFVHLRPSSGNRRVTLSYHICMYVWYPPFQSTTFTIICYEFCSALERNRIQTTDVVSSLLNYDTHTYTHTRIYKCCMPHLHLYLNASTWVNLTSLAVWHICPFMCLLLIKIRVSKYPLFGTP